MKPAAPVTMWAVLIIQKRSQWISYGTIARTRKAAADEWLAGWIPEHQEHERRQRNKTWRTVRVTVALAK